MKYTKELLINHVNECFVNSDRNESKLSADILSMEGMSGTKTRHLYNNICSLSGANYLEIGVFRGSTFCSAIYGNNIKATGIDNWSSPYLMPNGVSQKMTSYLRSQPSDPKEEFLTNVKKFGNVENNFSMILKNK